MAKTVYIPFKGVVPRTFNVNGHRLLILAGDEALFSERAQELEVERIEKVEFSSNGEQEKFLAQLAEQVGASLVISPPEVNLSDLLKGLSSQLPWLH